jgi:predicted phage terminase large subunit-like protein
MNSANLISSLAAKPRAAELKETLLDELARQLADRIVRRTEEAFKSLPLLDWGGMFLRSYFRLPPSRMHRWLGGELDRLDATRGAKLNVLGPRGSAKSTLGTLAYVLRRAVEEREPYVWIVSDTIGQACAHLAHVKAELESNELLAAYYSRATGKGKVWRKDAIELRNGVVVEAYGTGQQLRGRRRRQYRPSLIVCDDLQNDEQTTSALQRSKSRDWFHGALMKAGDGDTNVVNFATALHREALAMELHRQPGWRSQLFRSIEVWPERMDLWREWEDMYANADDPDAAGYARIFFEDRRDEMSAGAELLWPEHESLYALMKMRVDSGRTTFEREKQNSPIDPTQCEWPDDYFGHHIWFDKWPCELTVKVLTLDPSKGADARHSDYSAYVLLGIDRHGVLYVEADLQRRPTPAMVDDGVRIVNRFRPDAVGIEANQYQQLLEGEFRRACSEQHVRVPRVELTTNVTNKKVRIRRIGPLLAQRRMRFLKKDKSTELLVDQLRDFPLGAHDDGPDALEMALRLAEQLTGEPLDDGLGSSLLGWT